MMMMMPILFITISNHPSTIDYSSEAGMLLVGIEPFDTTLFDGYIPMGHRGDMLLVMDISHHILYSYTLSLSFTLSTIGHGGSFIVRNPELYTITSPSSVSSSSCRHYTGIVACQAPLYVHEVHLISNTVDEAFLADTSLYEMMVTCYIECLIERLYEHKRLSVKNPVWSVDFVDLYICPRRNKLIYTIQGTTVVYISCILYISYLILHP